MDGVICFILTSGIDTTRYMPAAFRDAGNFVILYAALIIIHAILGKKAAFPYGVVMGISPWTIGLVVLIYDLGLMILVRAVFDGATGRLKILQNLQNKLFMSEERLKRSRWLRTFQNLGRAGVVIIVSTPCAGGVWSGAVLSHILKLERIESYWLMGIGSAIGALIFVLSFLGIIHWVG